MILSFYLPLEQSHSHMSRVDRFYPSRFQPRPRFPFEPGAPSLSSLSDPSDRTRGTRRSSISDPVGSSRLSFDPQDGFQRISGLGWMREGRRRRRSPTETSGAFGMATSARVLRLPGARPCIRRAPTKVRVVADAMEEPVWEGHAERMRMLLESEAREAMKRQVHRLDKVRARKGGRLRRELQFVNVRSRNGGADGMDGTVRARSNGRNAPRRETGRSSTASTDSSTKGR